MIDGSWSIIRGIFFKTTCLAGWSESEINIKDLVDTVIAVLGHHTPTLQTLLDGILALHRLDHVPDGLITQHTRNEIHHQVGLPTNDLDRGEVPLQYLERHSVGLLDGRVGLHQLTRFVVALIDVHILVPLALEVVLHDHVQDLLQFHLVFVGLHEFLEGRTPHQLQSHVVLFVVVARADRALLGRYVVGRPQIQAALL